MFTGIVEELGKVRSISRAGLSYRLVVGCSRVMEGVSIGDSVAVNGACLTVVEIGSGVLSFDVLPETYKLTNIGSLRPCENVNLERSLKAGDRISGHFVLGHVDCQGVVRKKGFKEGNRSFEVAVEPVFSRYVVPKGSICIDGISLTVAFMKGNSVGVYVIPHTLKNTTLFVKGPSDKVNVEFDILAKRDPSRNIP